MKRLMGRMWVGVTILCLGQVDLCVRAGEVIDANRVQELLRTCQAVAATDDPEQAESGGQTVRSFLATHEVLVDAKPLASAKDLFDALMSRSAVAKEVRIRAHQARKYGWFEVSVAGGQMSVRELPLVEFRTDDRGLGFLRWRCCSGGAIQQVMKSLERAPALKGLFVDLRGNPGGHLVEALAFADQFLPKDTEMVRLADSVEDYQKGQFSLVCRAKVDPVYHFPVVFITDGATGSTAEAMVAVFKANWIGVSIGRCSSGDAFAYRAREGDVQAERGSISLISVPNFPVYHNKGIEPDNPTSQDIRPETLFANADYYYAALGGVDGSHNGIRHRSCVLLAQLAVSPPTE